jgi:hypothetical protein
MGRLNKLTTYLIGSIENDLNCYRWRDNITKFLLPKGVRVLNPLEKPVENGKETPEIQQIIADLKNTEQYDKLVEYRDFRLIDLRCCDVSDFLIFYLDLDIITCGSWEEFFISNKAKKPILICCKQGKSRVPSWVFWSIPHQYIFSDWQSLKDYLINVDSNPSFVDNTDRWRFFKYA